MRVHGSALASKEGCHTTTAKEEEIFRDMSSAPFTVANKTADGRHLSTTPTAHVLCAGWHKAAGHAARDPSNTSLRQTAVAPPPLLNNNK